MGEEHAWKTPKGILSHHPADRHEWLALRDNCVTASDAGALLGVHEYTTAYELWGRKMGLVPPMNQDEPVLLRGELLEDDALELVRRKFPDWRLVPNQIGHNGVFLEDRANRLGGTPDAFCIDGEEIPGIIEIKTTDHWTFAKKWGGAEDPQPPLWIAVQGMLNAYLAGARKVHIAVMCVGRTLDLHTVTLEVNTALIRRLQQAADAFWQAVARGEPPDPDYQRDGEAIKVLLPTDNGQSIDLSDDNEFCVALVQKLQLDKEIAELKARQGRVEAILRHKIGQNSIAVVQDRIVATNKLVTRKPYAVGASSYRKLVVKPLIEDEP